MRQATATIRALETQQGELEQDRQAHKAAAAAAQERSDEAAKCVAQLEQLLHNAQLQIARQEQDAAVSYKALQSATAEGTANTNCLLHNPADIYTSSSCWAVQQRAAQQQASGAASQDVNVMVNTIRRVLCCCFLAQLRSKSLHQLHTCSCNCSIPQCSMASLVKCGTFVARSQAPTG